MARSFTALYYDVLPGVQAQSWTGLAFPLPQAALAAAQQRAGGVIFLPAGIYVLARPLVVTRSNVVLRGAGQGLTTIQIPVSLSDVYQGTWALGNDGKCWAGVLAAAAAGFVWDQQQRAVPGSWQAY